MWRAPTVRCDFGHNRRQAQPLGHREQGLGCVEAADPGKEPLLACEQRNERGGHADPNQGPESNHAGVQSADSKVGRDRNAHTG